MVPVSVCERSPALIAARRSRGLTETWRCSPRTAVRLENGRRGCWAEPSSASWGPGWEHVAIGGCLLPALEDLAWAVQEQTPLMVISPLVHPARGCFWLSSGCDAEQGLVIRRGGGRAGAAVPLGPSGHPALTPRPVRVAELYLFNLPLPFGSALFLPKLLKTDEVSSLEVAVFQWWMSWFLYRYSNQGTFKHLRHERHNINVKYYFVPCSCSNLKYTLCLGNIDST